MGSCIGPKINVSNLVFVIDAGNTKSYAGTGTNVYDIVSGIGASLVGGVGFSSAYSGSFYFDGLNDYINIPDNNLLTSVNNLSLNMWFNCVFTSARYTDFIGKGTSDSNEEYTIVMAGSTFLFDIGGVGPYLQPSYLTSANIWYNICATHSRSGGSSDLRLYLNGTQLTATTMNPTLAPNDNTSDVTIGRRYNAGPAAGSTFQGNISQVQIYNKTLSAEEVLQNYNAQKSRYGL